MTSGGADLWVSKRFDPSFPPLLRHSCAGGNPARRPTFRLIVSNGPPCVTKVSLDPRLRGGDKIIAREGRQGGGGVSSDGGVSPQGSSTGSETLGKETWAAPAGASTASRPVARAVNASTMLKPQGMNIPNVITPQVLRRGRMKNEARRPRFVSRRWGDQASGELTSKKPRVFGTSESSVFMLS